MTLIYVEEQQASATGYFHYPEGNFVPNVGTRLNIITKLQEDLGDFMPYGEPIQDFVVIWYLQLFSEDRLSNTSRFKSALPKYDLGTVVFTMMGAVTDEHYWNYESQRFPTQTFFYNQTNIVYPSRFSAEGETDHVYIYATGDYEESKTNNYANDAWVQLTGSEEYSTIADVYYYAIATTTIPPAKSAYL